MALRAWTVVFITAFWTGLALYHAWMFVTDYPQYAAKAYLFSGGTGVLIGLLHLGILSMFRSTQACVGLIIAKCAMVPLTLGLGFFAFGLSAMSTDGGMEPAASQAWMIVPFCLAFPALPSLIAALTGAAIGQMVSRRKAAAAA